MRTMLQVFVKKSTILHLLCKTEKQRVFLEIKISLRISYDDNQVTLPRDLSVESYMICPLFCCIS